jgi:hypothetical protein
MPRSTSSPTARAGEDASTLALVRRSDVVAASFTTLA